MTSSQHLAQAAVQMQIAASLIHARNNLEAAGYGNESRYLAELAVSLHDTGHDLTHHTIHPED